MHHSLCLILSLYLLQTIDNVTLQVFQSLRSYTEVLNPEVNKEDMNVIFKPSIYKPLMTNNLYFVGFIDEFNTLA